MLSIEDEWPTFLVRYSHLILPLSPLSATLTDYTWQRLDEGRWRLGARLLWRNKHLNGCSWLHSSTEIILKNLLQTNRRTGNKHQKIVTHKSKNSCKNRVYGGQEKHGGKAVGLKSHRFPISPCSFCVPLCSEIDIEGNENIIRDNLSSFPIFQWQSGGITSCQWRCKKGSRWEVGEKKGWQREERSG